MKIGIDIDGTLTTDTVGWDYINRTPNLKMIAWVNKMYDEGHFIELFTARLSCDRTITKKWLRINGVQYNSLILGKPKYDLYIDDIAKRPEEVMEEERKEK
jgi:uncharacterized HAD superfamily protein